MFTDVTVGNNDLHHGLGGLYPATTGYDEASGLGTPLVVGLDGLGISHLELPGLAARICRLAASTNKVPAVSRFTPSAILPGTSTTVTVSGKGFLTIAGSTVLHLDADHSMIATCVSTTSCTFNSGSLPTGTYSPTIEVEKLASSPTPAFTVSDPISTSLAVTASPSAVTYGTQSTLRGVMSPSGVTGSVTFSTGATVLCSGTIVSGIATCLSPKSLGVGTYEVLGSFGGTGPFAASSALTSLEIARSSSSVAISASPAAPLPGAAVVVTTRVAPSDATGIVEVSIGNGGACTVTLASGVGSCTAVAPTLLGSQPVRAVYRGDSLREGSNSTGSLTVQQIATVTSMTRPTTPVPSDGTALWSAAVAPASVTGSATFSAVSGGVTTGRCTATILSGRASCSAPVLAPGTTIKVTAMYSGSAIASASSVAANYPVVKVAATFKVAVTPAVVSVKKSFAISVSGLRPQATGVVTFKVGGIVLCSAPLIGGAGKCMAKAQSKSGRITVSAVYPGDVLHLAATVVTPATVR